MFGDVRPGDSITLWTGKGSLDFSQWSAIENPLLRNAPRFGNPNHPYYLEPKNGSIMFTDIFGPKGHRVNVDFVGYSNHENGTSGFDYARGMLGIWNKETDIFQTFAFSLTADTNTLSENADWQYEYSNNFEFIFPHEGNWRLFVATLDFMDGRNNALRINNASVPDESNMVVFLGVCLYSLIILKRKIKKT